MGNTVYAWDADTGELLWKTNVGTPINGKQTIDSHNINLKWGIMSTPVIDRAAGALYACAWISPDTDGQLADGPAFRCRAGPHHRRRSRASPGQSRRDDV